MWSYSAFALSVVLIIIAGTRAASAVPITYDASLGSLPDAQGWAVTDTGGSPTPSVSGGVLFQGSTATSGVQYWTSTGQAIPDFAGVSHFLLQAEVRIVQSPYDTTIDGGTAWRAGYYFSVGDSAAHAIDVGITDSGIRLSNLSNDYNARSSAFVALDTTTAFNTYQLDVSAGVAKLSVNGNLVTSIGVGPGDYSFPNSVAFGDLTAKDFNQSQTKYVTYSSVPEPTSSSLVLFGVGMAFLRRRRRQTVGERTTGTGG